MASRSSGGSRRRRSTSGSASRTTRSGASGRRAASTRAGQTVGADKSVEAFRDALEHSVTLSRDRLQEVMDDAVRRGRMTRADANELISNLITRGRRYRNDLIQHDRPPARPRPGDRRAAARPACRGTRGAVRRPRPAPLRSRSRDRALWSRVLTTAVR